MKKIVLMLSLAASLLSISSMARADLVGFLNGVNKQALNDIGDFNDKLSKQFGIPLPNVSAIVKSLPDPADAFMVLQLSQMSNVAPEVVMQKYKRKKRGKKQGWGDMAHELGIKPGSPEFHALKRGDFEFSGRRQGDRDERYEDRRERRDNDRERDEYEDRRGNDHGHGHGRGKNKDRD